MEHIDSKELSELRRKAQCWDDLLAAKAKTENEPDDTHWKMVARTCGAIDAIKACRAAHGFSLREARDCVDSYLDSLRR